MRRLMAVVLFGMIAGPSHADIFKCVSPDGDVLFTSDLNQAKQKGCTQIVVTPNVVSPPPPAGTQAPAARSSSPENFPKVAPQVQQQRDNDRKKILETELINEEKNLQDARRELAEQENTRLGSERNAQRMIDRIEPYQKKVKLHEDNIANLRKELSNIR
ncbi:MAG TPA: DUF4124 domain-containing protein [Burkholderiales bacterium]|nr:DUF4124 domain-containing protein [Burkholderiales bacterium]